MVGTLGLKISLDQGGTEATFNGFMKKIAIRIGNPTAIVDGKKIRMSAAPFIVQDPTTKATGIYVPIRFAVQALGGSSIHVDPNKHIITAEHLQAFNVTTDVYQGSTYTMRNINGDLYVSRSNNKPVKIASIHDTLDFFGFSSLGASTTPKGLQIVRVKDATGEPHIYHRDFTLLFKNRSLIRQSSMDYYLSKRSNMSMYNGNIVLNDGQNLRIIEDGTGKVLETIDLIKLGGKQDRYIVEGLQSDIILLRAVSNSHLTLVYRHTGQAVVLYKKLLTAEQQALVDPTTIPFGFDDSLTFIKRSGNTLYFTYAKGTEREQQLTYTLNNESSS